MAEVKRGDGQREARQPRRAVALFGGDPAGENGEAQPGGEIIIEKAPDEVGVIGEEAAEQGRDADAAIQGAMNGAGAQDPQKESRR